MNVLIFLIIAEMLDNTMDSSIQPQLCQSVCNKNGWLDIVALPSQIISTYKPTPHFILENEEI